MLTKEFSDFSTWLKDYSARIDHFNIQLLPSESDGDRVSQLKLTAQDRMNSLFNELQVDGKNFNVANSETYSCIRINLWERKLSSITELPFGIYLKTNNCLVKNCEKSFKCVSI